MAESQPGHSCHAWALPGIETVSAKAKLKTTAKLTAEENSSNDDVPYENIDTSTGKDSGFCDAKEFLKTPLADKNAKPHVNEDDDDDDNHYEVISNILKYTPLTAATVDTTSEYTEPRPQ